MAKATANCKCKKCGATFTKTKNCYSREEANNWEAWAAENMDTCPECYKAEKEEERSAAIAEILNSYNLPELTGTEKQIKYAENLRISHIVNSERSKIDHVVKMRTGVKQATLEKLATTKGISKEEVLQDAFKVRGLLSAYVALYSTSAAEVIENLK